MNSMKQSYIVPITVALVLAVSSLASAATINSTLSVGSSGSEVTALQNYLSADSSLYPEGKVTGYYGSLTQAAVLRFQARYGISQTGTVGPITGAKINSLLGTGGGETGDVNAPLMTPETVTATNNGATISWTTSEGAQSKIYYSTSFPFIYSLAASNQTALFTTVPQVSLTGLSAGMKYYYARESVDNSGNIMWTVVQNFTTPTTPGAVTTISR